MEQYYYFPILKTRPSEVNAYDTLDDSVKSEILPIIEMTGELGYTYTKKSKDENKRGTRRPGDINKKIEKILNFMGQRRFILDITDDASLKHDGLSNTADGLLNPADGYKNWRVFLAQNTEFKKQVIPTIQFQVQHIAEVKKQIEELDKEYRYLAVKLKAFLPDDTSPLLESQNPIPAVIDFIFKTLGSKKLFLILDFDYCDSVLSEKIRAGLVGIDTRKLKALIPVSSSFPSSISSTKKPPLPIFENDIFSCVKDGLSSTNIYHGDYSSIYPTRYEMGGGGWVARIDYIIRDKQTKQPKSYNYERGNGRNKSSEYAGLATTIVNSFGTQYTPIAEMQTYGDIKIAAKAIGGIEGKAPSYWITVRSNIYMTMQYLYLKKQGACLAL